MIKDTSLQAYFELYAVIGKRQLEVYNAFKRYGAMTNKQLAQRLDWPINCVTPRVKELRALELVEVADIVMQLNSRKAILWQLTGKKISEVEL